MTCPPQKRLDNAFSLLRKIECISEDGRITEHGKNIAEFPLHPRIAHAVMKMQKKGNGFEAACFAAVLSDKNFLKDHQINVCERIKYFNRNYKSDNIDF